MLHNFDVLTGVTSGPVPLMPLLIPIAALVGTGGLRPRRDETAEIGSDRDVEPTPEPVVSG